MSRQDFYIKDFELISLDLWRENPRLLYSQKDEQACIAKLLNDKKFPVLLEDIARNGLGITPIVVTPIDDHWVVMDGNRRVAAMKLLEDISLCPPELGGTAKTIASLAKKYKQNLNEKVSCYVSEDEDAIAKHLMITHNGEQGGLGQVDWNALLQAIFRANNNMKSGNASAYRLLVLAQSYGYHINEDYPISTLGRFPLKAFCQDIGVTYPANLNKPLEIKSKKQSVVNTILEFVSDVGEKRVSVSTSSDKPSAREKAYRDKYLKDLVDKHSSKPEPKPKPDTGKPKPVDGGGSNKPSPKPTPKPTYKRNKFIPARRHTSVPKQYTKEYNVFADMANLTSKDTPIACVVVLRVFFEATLKKTIEAIGGKWRPNQLDKNTEFLASKLFEFNEIDKPLRDKIIKISGKDQTLSNAFFSINTIQAMLHSQHFHPDTEGVNHFWDELDPFLSTCWDMVLKNEA